LALQEHAVTVRRRIAPPPTCSSLILSGRRLDYIVQVQLAFGEKSGVFPLTLLENRPGFGLWGGVVKLTCLDAITRYSSKRMTRHSSITQRGPYP
jgi:hypothetical protein